MQKNQPQKSRLLSGPQWAEWWLSLALSWLGFALRTQCHTGAGLGLDTLLEPLFLGGGDQQDLCPHNLPLPCLWTSSHFVEKLH